MSKGQYRVNIDFNPTGNVWAHEIMLRTAELIDSLQSIVDVDGEAARCAELAQTKYEEAAMWAVKAITKPQENYR